MIQLEEMKNLLSQYDENSVLAFAENFRPFDLAVCVEKLDRDEQLQLLKLLSPDLSAEIIEYLEPVL